MLDPEHLLHDVFRDHLRVESGYCGRCAGRDAQALPHELRDVDPGAHQSVDWSPDESVLV